MPEKLKFEVVYNYFKDQGCELLETEYVSVHTKMRYRCKCDNESLISFNNFKNLNRRCMKCGGNEKLTYDFVYNFFKNEGCELLETEYINSATKMRYRCKCENESEIIFNNFQSGHKCAKCSGNEKLTFSWVYNYFEDQGCELLETKYINNSTKMKYLCSCGNKSSITFKSFKRHKSCRECRIKKQSGPNHPNWNTDRTRRTRCKYLQFKTNKINKLHDDSYYTNYLNNPELYSVDHIQPRVAFIDNDLDKKYDIKLIQEICNLRENLRIIPRAENGSKGGKYNQDEFMAWFNEKINLYNSKENINANCKNNAIDKSVGCSNNQLDARCG